MPFHVCNGAQTMCTFGMAPAPFNVLPIHRMITSDQPAANINDYIPMVNVMPHGVCMTPSNPEVAAATAAALGVLTPMPCIPVTTAPWAPGSSTVLIGSVPALDTTSTCQCLWCGVIQITSPAQMT